MPFMEADLHLTEPQKQAVIRGDAIPVTIESTDCVVVRADVFQRVRALVDEGLHAEQIGQLIDENMRDEDTDDPLLDSYQR
ncbi:MAG TPA: hypothetical protein VHV77_09280 [Pirellulales bacterium]|jgi:hypothetical protein|nr:hypothetical protein [Pirellulales bacterium]